MCVVATAGHVDHGKSTLVRVLTGSDPDRLPEEHRRGLTIELGYAWTTLPSGRELTFVDVPGHERFLATMLAGVGPVPAVLLVVAADAGWARQTTEHLAALQALGVRHGVVAVTRADLAAPAAAVGQVRDRLAGTGLGAAEIVTVSGATGAGLGTLRAALDRMLAEVPRPEPSWRVRLFTDRVFAPRGAGTVVTATLTRGELAVGDRLTLAGRPVTVRGLQSRQVTQQQVAAVARVAVNLRGIDHGDIRRGDALLTPGVWPEVTAADVELTGTTRPTLPAQLVLHVGATSVPVRVRVLAGDPHAPSRFARLRWTRPLPLEPGDRGVLRNPGAHAVAAGVTVLDVDPPALTRRGSARARAAVLADPPTTLGAAAALTRDRVAVLGRLDPGVDPVEPLVAAGRWLVDPRAWEAWGDRLAQSVDADPHGIPVATAAAGLPDPTLLAHLLAACGLDTSQGRVRRPGQQALLDVATAAALAQLELGWAAAPFRAPEAGTLAGLGLTARHLAVLHEAGLVLRLAGPVVLPPDAPDRAVAALVGLAQPFTLAQARERLGTTRRVAVPLLEHLDRVRATVRVDASLRRLRAPGPGTG